MNNSTKHTPGPWGYRKHLPGTQPKPLAGEVRMFLQDAWYIHGPKDNSDFLADLLVKNDAHSEANARLIAAAPDLLEACKIVEKQANTVGCEDDDHEIDILLTFREVKAIRAAIAKAGH